MLVKKGVTRVQWIALYYLGIDKYMSQKDLANKMNIKESTVARLIDRMEREGLVRRERNEEDRRVINLILTEKGKEYREELLPEGDKFNNIVSKNISDEEFELFLSVLNRMVKNLKDHMQKE